jgi:sarcosine oxidase subunit beta
LAPTLTAVGRNLSLKQSASGQFMVGGRWFGTMEDGVVGTRPIDAHIARQWDAAAAIYPAVGRLRIAQSWAGAEAQSIDSLPVIGRAPIAGLYLATGFSNHGFQISPEIGALVCNDIVAGEAPLLAPFRPDRATGTTADQVRAFRHEPIDI